jgi:hypothetical protein
MLATTVETVVPELLFDNMKAAEVQTSSVSSVDGLETYVIELGGKAVTRFSRSSTERIREIEGEADGKIVAVLDVQGDRNEVRGAVAMNFTCNAAS